MRYLGGGVGHFGSGFAEAPEALTEGDPIEGEGMDVDEELADDVDCDVLRGENDDKDATDILDDEEGGKDENNEGTDDDDDESEDDVGGSDDDDEEEVEEEDWDEAEAGSDGEEDTGYDAL